MVIFPPVRIQEGMRLWFRSGLGITEGEVTWVERTPSLTSFMVSGDTHTYYINHSQQTSSEDQCDVIELKVLTAKVIEPITPTDVTEDQFQRMIRGSMARGPMYEADPDEHTADARVRQMLDRAGLTYPKY